MSLAGEHDVGRGVGQTGDRCSRLLPRGWGDLLQQAGLWLGFALGYEIARGLADRGEGSALANADRVVAIERHLGGLYDLDLQRWALGVGGALVQLANWTYWLSQFAILVAGVTWIYFRHHDAYPRLRNTLFAVNALGLIGYVSLPTAPPRFLTGIGFVDTLSTAAVTFQSGIVKVFANPYAAMPSLHAADALVLGVALASVARSTLARIAFLLWPAWVWFSLLVTANHFWLDVIAGAALGMLGVTIALLVELHRDPVPAEGPPPIRRR
jgi:membrane-associated phospholipid phosphatase